MSNQDFQNTISAANSRPMSSGSDANLRDQMDRAMKETKWLKQRVDILERENFALKKSVFDLSTRLSVISASRGGPPLVMEPEPFDLNGDLTGHRDASTLYTPSSPIDSHLDFGPKGKDFYLKYDLKGHTGAVYTVKYSACGRYLASGSFDKTIRVWDAVNAVEMMCLQGHSLNISDVAWSADTSEILSGAYDQTCKLWDVESSQLTMSFDCEGFVQCIQYNPRSADQFFFGTTRKSLGMIDKRKNGIVANIHNDAMVNTLHAYRDGYTVLTGDSLGALKTWDIRSSRCILSTLNEPTKKPISHIAVHHGGVLGDDEPRYMAVNSYDNIIRVYDRGMDPIQTPLKLLHTLKGHRNKNWPVKSAFYQGKQSPILVNRHGERSPDYEEVIFDSTRLSQIDSLLLASGSADNHVYLYAMTTQSSMVTAFSPIQPQSDGVVSNQPTGTCDLVQRLSEHADRVYAVDFHPTDPVLASCSADFGIKIWAMRRRDLAPIV